VFQNSKQKVTRAIATALMVVSPTLWADLKVVTQEAGIMARPSTPLQSGERILALGSTKKDIEKTKRIPAELGVKFGVRYTLDGKKASDNRVLLLYLTPGVIDQLGQLHDIFDVSQNLSAGAVDHQIAFEFTENYELVPGDWRFMVFDQDRLLIDQTFEVYQP